MAPINKPNSRRLRLKKESAAQRFCLNQLQPTTASTPSLWFSRRCPVEADRYGVPILEEEVVDADGTKSTIPLHLNDSFFAAILSDSRLGHSVVFYETEQQWYYLDPIDRLYHPTTEAKLMNLLSGLLARCAEEMDGSTDRYNLFVTFREAELLKAIVKKARSVLAADPSFFSISSPNRRIEGPEQYHQTARRFITSAVKPREGTVLSVGECFERFNGFCANNGVKTIDKTVFKNLVVEIIKEEFGLGLRADLKTNDGHCFRGWKGLAVELNSRN